MSILEIIAVIIFPITLSSYGLMLEQKKTSLADRMSMFRSEFFTNIVFFPSFVLMIASGVILFLYSWKILIITFIITAILYPLLGRILISRLWSIPYYFLNKWASQKLKK